MTYTPEQRKRIRRRRMLGHSWEAIAADFNTTSDRLRRAVEPGYAEHRKMNARRFRMSGPSTWRVCDAAPQSITRNPEYDPARDGPPRFESITAMILGDPPIGRRAIDQRDGGSNGL